MNGPTPPPDLPLEQVQIKIPKHIQKRVDLDLGGDLNEHFQDFYFD